MISLFPYIGGKHRMARTIARELQDLALTYNVDTLVDVFGGSAAVLLNSGFTKRIYNDISEDLVMLFKVIASPILRRALLQILKWTPPSRQIFKEDYEIYLKGGLSFREIKEPVLRARAVLYRQMFVFGGKPRSGGFCVSTLDRRVIKEVNRYGTVLRKLNKIGDFFTDTVIECLDFRELIRTYGSRKNVIFFCDPPYPETQIYYAHRFSQANHAVLAHLLSCCSAKVVCTFYENNLIRQLYPAEKWNYRTFTATTNCRMSKRHKKKMTELILTRRY